MSENFAGLKPEALWKHFDQILKIPHCSGHEKALGDYIIGQAKGLGLAWKKDKVGNVVVSKPATPGKERATGIILQGHLDMVCEKNSDVAHDFSRDPIVPVIKNGWVQARGTTLGSDNGIGLSTALAVLEEKSLAHGPLECLFTTAEETGLDGARLIEPGFLQGKQLLNLDSEELGTFTIGCAGGADSHLTLPLQRRPARGLERYLVKLTGYRGGHSGIDIHLGRGNAIRLLARLLMQLQEKFSFRLAHFEGGNKHNAIPREAWAEVQLPAAKAAAASSFLRSAFGQVKGEFQTVEKEASLGIEKAKGKGKAPLTPAAQQTFLRLLLALPHGVLAMHPDISSLVETSNNLAIVRVKPSQASILCSSRSSIASALESVRLGIKATADLAGAKTKQPEGYPGWKPNLTSPLLKALKDVHQRVFGKEAAVVAIHAGLECGLIGEKFPGMDMISFGPTIQHPHSPEERVDIKSVEEFWKLLTESLRILS